MAALPTRFDPTLAAADAALEARAGGARRAYLGASQIGNSCDRALWYAFRQACEPKLTAKSLKAIQDGNAGEAVMAERLRAVPGVRLWTEDDSGRQFGFVDFNGHLGGHADGVIDGLLQAPRTAHVWEHKQVNEKKYARLVALAAADEKSALERWDPVYFIQAQLYMHYLELERHYLTCSTPGGREQTSCRTNYQPPAAARAIERAKRIITAARLPGRLSDDPGWFACKGCDFYPICHWREIAAAHCRTCAHSTALLEGAAWTCDRHQRALAEAEMPFGCPAHLYHPDLLENHAVMLDGDPDAGTITYRMKDTGVEFKNGLRPSPDAAVYASHEIRCAAAGGADPNANRAWLDAAGDPHVALMRVAFDASIKDIKAK